MIKFSIAPSSPLQEYIYLKFPAQLSDTFAKASDRCNVIDLDSFS